MADQRLPLEGMTLPEVLQQAAPTGVAAPAYAPPPIPDAPSPGLPSLLTALAGLGLNVAGAAQGRGAVGNGTLAASQNLYEQDVAQASRKNTADQAKYKAERQAAISESLAPLRTQLRSADRPVYDAYLASGEDEKARSLLRDQRYYDRMDKGQSDDAYRGIKNALNSHIKQIDTFLSTKEKDTELQARKSQVETAARQGQFYANQPAIFSNPEELKAAVNKNPKAAGFAGKLDSKDAQVVYEQYRQILDSKAVPARSGIKAIFKMKELPTDKPNQLFSDYAERIVGPEQVQVLRQEAGNMQLAQAAKAKALELNELHESPKTRKLAQQIYDSGLIDDPPPAKMSWTDWYKLSPEGRNKARAAFGK